MAAEKITEIIDDAAFAQLDKLLTKLGIAQQSFIDAAASANKFNNEIGGAKTLSGYTDLANTTAKAIDNVAVSNSNLITTQKAVVAQTEAVVVATKAKIAIDADASKVLAQVGGSIDSNIRLLIQQKTELKSVADEQKKLSTAYAGSAQSQAALSQKTADLTKRAIELKTAIAQNSLVIKQQVKDEQAAIGSNDQLNARLALLRKSYDGLNQAEKENTAIGGVFLKNISDLDVKTKAASESQGIYNKSVGNYGNFATKAFGLIRQAAYILPGIGVAGIFNLAIEGIEKLATTYGIFAEKITTAGKNLGNLNDVFKTSNREAGEQSTHLKILYAAATDVTNSLKDRIKAAQELKKEFPGTFKNETDLAIINGETSKSYQQLTLDILANAKARAAASKISELAAQQLDADFQIQKIKIANANEITAAEKKTQASTEAGFKEELRRRGLSTNLTRDQIEGLKKLNDAQLKVNEIPRSNKRAQDSIKEQEANKKSLQDQIDFLVKFAGGNNKIAKALSAGETGSGTKIDQKGLLNEKLKEAKLNEQEILNNENATFQQRIDAINKFEVGSLAIIKRGEKAKVLTQLEASNLSKGILSVSIADTEKMKKEADAKLSKGLIEGLKLQVDSENAAIEALKDGSQKRLAIIEQNKSDVIDNLVSQYSKGLISERLYNIQLRQIDNQAAQDRIDEEVKTAQAIIAIRRALLYFGIGSQKELSAEEARLATLQIQRSGQVNKIKIDDAKDAEQLAREARDIEIRFAEEAARAIETAIDAAFQHRVDKLQQQSNLIDENTAIEKAAVERSLLTSKQKADKEAIIDANAAAKKKQIDAEIRAEKVKQAKFDRAAAIAGIIENTYLAASKVAGQLGIFGIPLEAVVIATGVAQLATVLATPIPQFFRGTDNAPEGLAWVGEKGAELRINPDGSEQLTPGVPTLTHLKAGTKIIPNHDLIKSISAPGFTSNATNQSIDISKLIEEQKLTRIAIQRLDKKHPTVTNVITPAGIRSFIKDGATRIEYLKRNGIG